MQSGLEGGDLQEALAPAWQTFLEFEAPNCSAKGVREFERFIGLSSMYAKLRACEMFFWGCFEGERVVGLIATRAPCHISLLFVKKSHHRRGIARALLQTALRHYAQTGGCAAMTVHASPYAVEVYRRLGFVPMGAEQTVDGLRFTPMRRTL